MDTFTRNIEKEYNTDVQPDSIFHAHPWGYLVNLKLAKHHTPGSLLSVFIVGAYPPSLTGFEPGHSNWKACVTIVPSAFAQANQNYRVQFIRMLSSMIAVVLIHRMGHIEQTFGLRLPTE